MRDGKKLISEPAAIIIVSTLKNIIAMFFGPFLSAYFVSSTVESLPILVKYNMMVYLALMGLYVLVGFIVRNHGHLVFVIGVALEFVVSAFVVLMGEKLIGYALLFGALRGSAEAFYWYPYNWFETDKIPAQERQRFTVTKLAVNKVSSIVVPIVFAGIITTTSFLRTSTIILVLSMLAIVVSFFIGEPSIPEGYNPVKDFECSFSDRKVRKFFFASFLSGMFDTDLSLVLPALIFMHNKSNMGLGIVTSMASLAFIVFQLLLNRVHNSSSKLKWLWIAVCISGSLVYLFAQSFATIVVFYVIYVVCYGFLSLRRSVIVMEFLKNYRKAFLFEELVLNSGRIAGLAVIALISSKAPSLLPYTLVIYCCLLIPHFCLIRPIEKELVMPYDK